MKNFKVEQRLVKDYKGVPRIRKVAVFEDKSTAYIQEMEDGTEYFCAKNPYYKKGDSFKDEYFIDCPKDAVMAVREGYADCLKGGNGIFKTYIPSLTPIVLLDREKAAEYRAKTIEGWKDAEFGYGISFGSKNSFAGYSLRDENGNACIFGQYTPIVFDTAEEAQKYFDEHFLNVAIDVAKKYIEYKGREESTKDLLNPYIFTLIFDLALELIEGKDEESLKLRDLDHLDELPNLGWDIIQVVRPKETEAVAS